MCGAWRDLDVFCQIGEGITGQVVTLTLTEAAATATGLRPAVLRASAPERALEVDADLTGRASLPLQAFEVRVDRDLIGSQGVVVNGDVRVRVDQDAQGLHNVSVLVSAETASVAGLPSTTIHVDEWRLGFEVDSHVMGPGRTDMAVFELRAGAILLHFPAYQ